MENENENELPDNGADKYFIGGGEHGFIGKAKACYIIVFESENDLNGFYDMLKVMKKMEPEIKTHGGRVSKFVNLFLEQHKDILAETKSKKSKKKNGKEEAE